MMIGMSMKVIGAGLPRTATLSQKVALEMLGLGPCYHMVDVLSDLGRADAWARALEGGADWEMIFSGYQATVDWPGSFFYAELVDRFPDAKVVLSVRDGQAWAESMCNTISGVLYGDTLMKDLSSARSRIDPAWARYIALMILMWEKSGLLSVGDPMDREALARGIEHYNEEVKRVVPPDRLLVWAPSDGWEPLCEHLEVPVPDAPFPNLNDSAIFADRIVDSALASLNAWRSDQGAPGKQ
jgi:hypothetical protein